MAGAVTTLRSGAPITKPFAWSYSKLKNFTACPKKHWHVDIAKDATEEKSEELLWGDNLHKAAAARLGKGKTPLPPGYELLQPWIERIETGPGTIMVEQQLAIAADFGPCSWFAKPPRPAWFRAIADVLKLVPEHKVALAIDWKSGKVKEDSVQLALMAACIFAHHPNIERIRTEFVWLAHDAHTRQNFARADMPDLWRSLIPRIDALKQAHDTMSYPPKPGGLCRKWCPVKQCPHNGV